MQAADALADAQTIREACASHAVPLRILLGSVESTRLPNVFNDAFATEAAADAVSRCVRTTATPAWLCEVRPLPLRRSSSCHAASSTRIQSFVRHCCAQLALVHSRALPRMGVPWDSPLRMQCTA